MWVGKETELAAAAAFFYSTSPTRSHQSVTRGKWDKATVFFLWEKLTLFSLITPCVAEKLLGIEWDMVSGVNMWNTK